MAKTTEDIVREQLGALMLQVAQLAAENSALKDEIAALKTEQAKAQESAAAVTH